MAQHYGVAVMPARPYKPRDKAKVENAVRIVERWIVAALAASSSSSRSGRFNEAIAELLQRLNHRRFRKREGTRASLFAELDRPALQPLPVERYVTGGVEKRSRQHRLSRRDRSPLLQRSVSVSGPAVKGARTPQHCRDLP